MKSTYFNFDLPDFCPLDIAGLLGDFADQKESVLGTGLRIEALRTGPVFKGDRARLIGRGRARVVTDGSMPVRGIAKSDAPARTLSDLIGFLAEPVTDSTGTNVAPATGTALFLRQNAGAGAIAGRDSVPFVRTDATRTQSSPGAFALDDGTMFLDGAAPTLEHQTLVAHDPIVEATVGSSTISRAFDATALRPTVLIAAGVNSTTLATWKFTFGSMVEDLNNGGTESVWARIMAVAGGTVTVTPRLYDASGNVYTGSTVVPTASYERYGLSWSLLKNQSISALGIVHFQLVIAATTSSTLRLELPAHMRFRPLRRFT